jgi:hypothetical protein
MKVLRWIWNYLKDWKNLLAHAIVGVGLLMIALYLPVHPVFRILIMAVVVIFNTLRMKWAKKRKAQKINREK